MTPITPKLDREDSKPLLVVERQITDQEGPFRVKLTNTVVVSFSENSYPVLNADARIIDDQDHIFRLFILGRGIYETTAKRLSEFTWLRCWVTVPSASIMVASIANYPVDELKGLILRSIGPGNTKLNVRYSILVGQYSIDADLYKYLKRLRDVNENSGGIYSNIHAAVYGNITCCEGSGKAMGYFAASSVKMKRFFLSRSDGYHMETIPFEGDCTSYLQAAFW